MAKLTNITNATIVEAASSTGFFLPTQINNRQVGIKVYSFEDPALDILPATPGFILHDTNIYEVNTMVPNGTSYAVPAGDSIAVAFSVNGSAYAASIFQIEQNPDVYPLLEFQTPTLVGSLTSTGLFMVWELDDVNYGLPLCKYSTVLNLRDYTFSDITSANPVTVTSVVDVGKPVLDITPSSNGSTYLNPKIEAYSDLLDRIKRLLGWPSINIDLCDETIAAFIDNAIELYTKYAGYTEEFLIFNTSLYKHGLGIKLDDLFSYTPEMNSTMSSGASGSYDYDLKDYRKVIDVWSFEQGESTGINTLFTMEQAMVQQVYYGNLLGSMGFDLVTWHITKEWLETREKVLAQKPYIRFNPRTQYMTILPEPLSNQSYYGCIGGYVEKPIRDLIAEPWVIFYVQALAKLAIGNVRGKFQGQVLFGGGTVNGTDLISQGVNEKEELEKQLLTGSGFVDVNPTKFFMC